MRGLRGLVVVKRVVGSEGGGKKEGERRKSPLLS